jgi:hypothetical protein
MGHDTEHIRRTGTIRTRDATLAHYRSLLVRELKDGAIEYLGGDSARDLSGWAALPGDLVGHVTWD